MTRSVALRPCLTCGRPSPTARCAEHTIRRSWRERGYTAQYDRNRRALLATATACWVCGQPGTPGDPLTADHFVPIADGGSNDLSNLRAAHRSCNSRRGRAPSEISSETPPPVPRPTSALTRPALTALEVTRVVGE